MTRTGDLRSLPRLSVLAASVLVAFGTTPAYALDPAALPTGGQVAAGSATINQTGARMDVNQATQKAIINWSTFNIGSGASVNFAQPNSSSVVLNRVMSSSGGSEILGRMTANGQVFLVNPSGVLFGKTAQVDVGGLVATSLNISDSNFLAGRYIFSSTGAAGSVTNEGMLRAAESGYIALLAPEVRNEGVITARLGTVALAAGNKVTLDFAGDRLVSLAIDEAALNALVENRHVVQADGGTVILAARAAGDLASTVVNNTGLIQAASVSERDGVIRLEGGERGVVAVSGTLDASGRGAGEHGGTIKVLGERVGLSSGATLDASGDAGGGTVLVGGNYQGSGPEQNASATYVTTGAQIKADALSTGDGGKVIVWSNDYTEFSGAISARGGATAGNGGFVETSGKNVLQASGTVDASAPAGQAGNWLLDPNNITIQTAGPDANVSGNPNFTTTSDSAIVTTGSIQTALNAGTSVTVTTGSAAPNLQAGDITVANAVAKTAGGNATLTLNATNGIIFSAGANVTSTTGQLNLTLNAGAGITSLQNVNTNGGVLTFNAPGAMTQAGVISGTGSVVNQGAGTLTLSSANTYSGGTTIKAGTVNANVATALGSGTVTLGDSAGGSNAATLTSSSTGAVTYANAIVLASNTTGTLTIGRNAAVGTKTFSGGVTGSNNLTVANNSTVAINFTGAVNNTGTITNSGSGTGAVTISAGVGSNVTAVTQNSATSALTIQTTALTVNSGGTTLTNSSGTALLTVSGGVTGTGDLILKNNSATAQGVTLTTNAVNNAGKITNSGTGTGSATVTAAVGANVTEIIENSTTSALTVSGAVTTTGSKTFRNASGGALLTVSGAVTGTGTVVLDNDSTLANGVTVSVGGINNSNTVTNLGSGTGSVLVSAAVGANVTEIIENSTTSALTVSGAVTTTGSKTFRNASGGALLTVSGAVTGTGTVVLDNDSTLANGVTVSVGGINNSNTVTNLGSGTGSVLVSGIIGANVTGVTQNSTTSQLNLSGNNTFTGGLTILRGTVLGTTSANAFSNAGSITLGDSAGGSDAATLLFGTTGLTIARPIVLAPNTTGTLSIGNANDIAALTFSGGVTGANDLTISNTSATAAARTIALTVGAVNNTGKITNIGTSTGATTISTVGGVGGNVTEIIENSTTSALTVSGAVTTTGSKTFRNASGGALLTVSGAVTGTGTVVLDNDSTLANGVTVSVGGINNSNTVTNLGSGTGSVLVSAAVGANVTEIIENSTTSALTVSGAVTTTGSKTFRNASGGALLTVSGAVTGTGTVVLDNDSTLANGVTVSVGGINNSNTVTNLGSGTGSVLVSGIIGANVTGVTQNSTTSQLNLSGNNTFTGGLTILRGTVLGTTSANAFSNAGSITLGDSAGGSDAATLLFGTTGLTIARPIVLAPNTTGTLSIGNANDIAALTFSGGVTGANDLTISNTSATAAARTIALTVGAVNNTGKITNIGTSTGATTISTVGGVGGNVTEIIENSTTSALTVSGAVTTTGSKTFRNASGGALLTVSGAVTGTGTVVLDNDSTLANGVTVSVGGINNSNTVTNLGSGTGSVLVSGIIGANVTGVTQNSTTSALTLSGANTYTATTNVDAGTLNLAGGSAIANTGVVVLADVAGATLNLVNSETIGNLSGGGATGGNVTLNANTLTTGDASNTTYAGVISGTGGLTKQGAGTFTLSGANTYDGVTNINAGTVAAGNATALGSTTGGTSVSSGATLNINNIAIGNEAISINGNGVGGAGALTGTDTASLAGTLTLAGASRIGTTSGATTLTLGGAVSAGGNALDITGAGNLLATNALNNFGTVTINGTGAVSLVDANALTIGASTTGSLVAQTLTGDLTLNGAITANAAGAGNWIVLAAAGNFVNNVGAAALNPGTGRWLVYTSDPATATFNGLVSGNLAIWNTTYPAGTALSGNRYLFGTTQTLTFTSDSLTKTYGDDVTGSLPTLFTVSGANTSTYGGVIVADSSIALSSLFSGAPSVASTGAAATANVTGSPYAVTIGAGTLSSLTGYGTSFSSTGTISVNPKTVDLSGTRVYDGTVNFTSGAFTPTITGTVGAETLVIASGTGTVPSKNVGTQTLTTGTLALGNGTGLASNYTLSGGTHSGVITARPITVTAATDTKTYDGTTSSAGVPTSGALGTGDTATFTQAFTTRDFGIGNKTLTPAGVVSDGNGGANYSYTYTPVLTGTINKLALTVTAATDTKTYDGTTSSAGVPTSGALGTGDTATFTQAFTTRDFGIGNKTLTPAGVVSDGNGGANYSYTYTPVLTGTINKLALTVTAATDTKTYDGTTSSAGVPTSGALGTGDTATFTQAFTTRDFGIGNKTLTPAGVVSDGNGGANYSYTYTPVLTGTINKLALTVTAATDTKTYDGTTSSAGVPTSGALGTGDTATFTQAFTTRDFGIGNKTLTPAGVVSDGNGGANYSYTYTPVLTGTINKLALTVTAATDTKTYDGTTSSAGVPTSGALGTGDTATFTQAFTTRDFGIGNKTLTPAGVVSDGNGGANYSYTYTPVLTGTINKLALTVTAATDTKTYDGTTSSAGVPTSGALGTGDTATFTQAFTTRDFGIGNKTLTPAGVVSDGNGGANYSYTYTPVLTGTINKLALTVTAATDTKTYDGTTSSAGVPTSGALGTGDTATFTQAFTTRDFGIGNKTLTPAGVVSDGNGGANYSYTYTPVLTGTINKLALTVTAATDTKTYDGTTSSAGVPTSGALGTGDTATFTQAFTTRDFGIGNKTLTPAGVVSDGNGGANYSYTYTPVLTGTINKLALTVTAATDTKTYDGTTSSAGVPTSGALGTGDTATFTQAFTTRDFGIGNKTLTPAGVVSDGNGGANYSYTYTPVLTGTINKLALTVTAATDTKTYDGTTSSAGVPTSGALGTGDTATFTQAFTTRDFGIGNKTLTPAGVVSDGNGGANYSYTYTPVLTGTINKLALTVTAATDTKTYDGTTSSAGVPTSGALGTGDTATFTQAFTTRDFGIGNKTLTPAGVVSDGNGGANYSYTYTPVLTGTINKLALTVTAATDTKTYDGTTSSAGVPTSGALGTGDTATFTQAFTTRDFGIGNKTLTPAGVVSDGNGGANYSYTYTPVLTGTINKLALTVTAATDTKTYDGTTSSAGVPTSGALGTGDTATFTQAFTTRDFGIGNKTLTPAGVVSDGNGGANYSYTYTPVLTGTINKLALTVTAATDTKTYDGTTSSAGVPTSGALGTGDTATFTQAFTTRDFGIGNKTLTPAGVVSDGNGGANYSYTYTPVLTGTINKLALTVTAATDTKTYDGTTSSAGVPTSGALGTGDTATFTQAFTTRDFGIGNKTLTPAGVVSDGNGGANYSYTYTPVLTGTINKLALTVTAATDTKTYDGTTSSAGVPTSGALGTGDTATFTQAFTTRDFGIGNKTLTPAGVVSDGNGGANYSYTYTPVLTGTINKLALTVTAATDTKTYDGTTSSAGVPTSGALGTGDTATFTQAFTTRDFGIGNKTLTPAGVVSDGNGGANYSYTYTPVLTGTINKLALTVTAATDTKTYDGTTSSAGVPTSGALGTGDTATFTQAFTTRDFGIGNKTLTPAGVVSDGNGGANYSYTYTPVLTGTINKLALTVTAATDTKTYDGTTSSAGVPTSGALGTGDTATFTQAFTTRDFGIGNKTLTPAGVVSDGNGGANYSYTYTPVLTGTINKLALTVTAATDTKTYDGTTSSAGVPTSGALGTGDTATFTQAFTTRDFGIGNKTLTPAGVVSDGNGGANYSYTYTPVLTGTINKLALTVTAATDTKTYDGTTSSAGVPTSGALGTGDTATFTQAFTTRDFGIGNKTLTPAGVVSDGNGGANYSYTYTPVLTGTINKLALTVTAATDTKTYDGTTSSAGVPTSGALGTGDTATFTQAFTTRDFGIGNKTLTPAGVVSDGNGGANYSYTYTPVLTGTINKLALTVTAATDTKTYDGTTSSAGVPTSGALGTGDTATFTQAFTTRDFGIGNKTLTPAGVVSDGNGGANYSYTYTPVLTGTINKLALTVTAATDTKTYDGTTSSAGVPTSGALGTGDTATFTQAFTTRDFGIGNKTLTPAGVVSDGNGGANYSYTYTPVLTGTINKLALTVTAATDTKTYDGTTSSAGVPTSGALGTGDTATFTQAFTTRDFGIGNKTLTPAGVVSDGNGGANYSYTYTPVLTGTINKLALTVTAATDTKTYDGTTSSAGVPTSGALGTGDTATFTQAFTTRDFGIGNKTLTPAGVVSDGNGGANYSYTYTPVLTGTINKLALTVTAATDTKTYDGTTSSAGVPTSGALGTGDTATFTQAFTTRDFGIGNKTLTPAGVVSDGNGGANYSYTYTPVLTGTINKLALTVTAATDTKTYDGTTSSAGVPTSGALGTGDTATFTQAFTTRDFGIGNKTLTPAGVVSDGNGGANYSYTYTPVLTGTINKLALTVTAATDTKTYDGTTSSAGVPTSGALGTGDTATFTQAFTTRDFGIGNKTLTPAGVVSDGNGGANYSYTYTPVLTGTINKLALTVTAATDTKTYDGTTSSAGVPTSGALGTGDTATFTQAFTTRDFGIGNKTLTPAGVVSDGNGGANYSYTYTPVLTGTINKLALTVTAATDTKTYDGTTSSAGVPTSGALGTGDTATFTQAFTTRDFGIGNKTLTPAGVVSDGNGGANYSYTYTPVLTGTINKLALTVTAATDTKTYDGTTSSAGVPTSGALGTGDTATFSQVFANRNAGSGKTLTASGVVNDGNAGANYSYSFVADTTGVITPAALAVTADNQTRPEMTPNPPFTATYSGFQGGDNASSLGGALVFATPATAPSPAGAYPITPSGVTSVNYTIAFIDGVLTVTAGMVTPPPVPPVSISAFSALTGAIASTINPPGMGVSVPSSAEFTTTLAPTVGGATADGSATVEHISPMIAIINCGIRSLAEGCGPR